MAARPIRVRVRYRVRTLPVRRTVVVRRIVRLPIR